MDSLYRLDPLNKMPAREEVERLRKIHGEIFEFAQKLEKNIPIAENTNFFIS